MTSNEFKTVLRLAEAMARYPAEFIPYEYEQAQIALIGYGLERKTATKREAAIILNAQTIMLNGIRDHEALETERRAYLRNVTLLD